MKEESFLTSIAKLTVVLILIVISGVVFGILGYILINFELKHINLEKIVELTVKDEPKCQENWKEYKHDIIGIKFCYPEQWGEPTTSPKSETTRLEDVVSEFSEHNSSYNSFFIDFSDKNISLRFFNEQYGGEYYPNALAYAYGYADNIPLLKSTGNICEYKIDFNENWQYKGKFNEVYNSCEKNIKTTVIEKTQFFDQALYIYTLKSFAYKKPVNGYFDNLLIELKHGWTKQAPEQLSTLSQFLNGIEKSEDQFQREKDEFVSFANSIKTYQPIHRIFQEFEIIRGEDPRITVIRKYYWFLLNNKIKEAYEMRSDKTELAYETFQDWYKDIYFAEPYDFKSVNSNEYEFYVKYQDHNKSKTKFRVKMFVSENTIKTLSSDEILSDEVSFGEYSAYVIKRGDKNYMILSENGEEIIIDEGTASYDSEYSNLGEVKSFHNPKFSPKGNYLTYAMIGWEWQVNYVYDIKEKAIKFSGSHHSSGFAFSEKYFYVCSSVGMITGADGIVYSVPDFEIEFDVLDGLDDYDCFEVDCEYDKNSENIIFTLSDNEGKERKRKSFSVFGSVK